MTRAALTMLQAHVASTGPGGVRARGTATISSYTAGSQSGDAATLLAGYADDRGISVSGRTAQDPGNAAEKREEAARERTQLKVKRLKIKTMKYQAALMRLTGGRGATSGAVMLAAAPGDGTGAVVSLHAPQVSSLYTGGGNDAVSLSGGRVNNVYTGAGLDAVAIGAERVDSVYSGEGADALAIEGRRVTSVYSGAGNDGISVAAGIAGGIYGGLGHDAITVRATLGDSVARGLIDTADNGPRVDVTQAAAALAGDAATRFATVLSNVADVDGGAGNDAITVTGAAAINIAGGAGDDLISVEGRTVGLHYGLGDGHDVVSLGAGTDIVLQLGGRPDGGADPGDYTVRRTADTLTVVFGSGAITFTGVSGAGMIAVMGQGDAEPVFLNGPTLDHAV